MTVAAPAPAESTPTGVEREGGASWWSLRLCALTLVFGAFSLAAVLTNSPGILIADARLEFSTDPAGFLAGHEHLWDATRGMGSTTTLYSPFVASFEAIVHSLGAPPWLVERLVHAASLTVAASGLAALLRVTMPRVGVVHLLGGLIYAFNPYTSQFLLPSGLFLSYALSPWFLSFFLRGARDRSDSWRMAAWFALCVFVVGALNSAALVYALVPIPIAAIYLVFVERSAGLRSVIAWTVRAGVLTLAVSAGALMVLWFQRGGVALNLETTERPSVVSARSSWSESWRGLGLWLTYFRDAWGQLRPQSAAYFQNPLVVVAAYGAPLAAGITLTLSRWRPRLFYAGLVALGVVVMVGVYPPSAPSPIGRLLNSGFENAVLLRGFRTTYKAGALFYIGVAVLSAYGIVALFGSRWLRYPARRFGRTLSTLIGSALLCLVVVAAFPYWTGKLYNPEDGFEEIPDYWEEALDWINARPEDGRVLVLPGVVRTRYRWGYVNDNLFHGLLDKSLVSHQLIPATSTPLAADVVLALDEYLASPGYREATAGPILRRLGVRWVLFQNDVDWQRVGVPRPSHFDDLRADPDLVRVRSFGNAGQNTTASSDSTAALVGETAMRPIEIYELTDAMGTLRVNAGAPVVVAGGGDAWPQLAQQGALTAGPVAYTGSMTDEQLTAFLAEGSRVVVTDGARRRYLQARTGRIAISHTLALDEDAPRDARSPFEDETSGSFVVYPDALTIVASRTGRGLTPFDPSQRPSRAFDDIDHTAWEVSGLAAEGSVLSVRLREETEIDRVAVLPFLGGAKRSIGTIWLELLADDGSVVGYSRTSAGFGRDGGWVTFDTAGSDVVEIRLRIEDLDGDPRVPVGIAEVEVGHADGSLDLREFLQTPRDLERVASRNAEIDELLASADVGFSFRRYIGTGDDDEETEVRRTFWAPREATLELQGTVQLTTRTPDVTVDRLLGGAVGAYGSTRVNGAHDGWGANAVDGDPTTSWLAPPTAGESLTVRPPSREVSSVELITTVSSVVAGSPGRFSQLEAAVVTATGRNGDVTVDVVPSQSTCQVGEGGDERCEQAFRAQIPRDVYETFQLEFTGVTVAEGPLGLRPVAVSEVTLDGRPLQAKASSSPLDDCVDAFTIDGRAVPVQLLGTRVGLLDHQAITFESCGEVSMEKGDHVFESEIVWSGAISELQLADAARAEDQLPEDGSHIEVIEQSPSRIVLDVTAPNGVHLLGPGAHHRGWIASIDGETLSPAVPLDTLSSWLIPQRDGESVVLTFRPQRSYELALAITAGGLAICLYLVARTTKP